MVKTSKKKARTKSPALDLGILSNIRVLLLRKEYTPEEIPAFISAVEYLAEQLKDYTPPTGD